jgi:CheY-like chemotaxis protein
MEAIGTLAGGIAHDFNNILSAVIGYTQIALDDVPKGTLLQSNLKEVLKAGRRARDVVKQILAFSRQTEQERKPLEISLIVKEALKLLRASLPATIEIRQNIGTDLGTVLADATQIHQVLMNLCTNAAHAMGERGGILEVNLANVELGSDFTSRYPDIDPGPYLRLTVSDTGHGMHPSIMERIFNPFFTTKERGEGTGMGLAVVHGIVKGYGGTITVFSEPGEGSTFHIYLPLIDREVEPEAGIGEPIPTGNEHILFIDDERAIVDVGKQILERLGYDVVTITSSTAALELFRAQSDKFDLVITDMTMPNMTGEELARELMNIRPDIPIILCSGYSKKITEVKTKDIGIRAFVVKPILKREIAETIRRVLDEKG